MNSSHLVTDTETQVHDAQALALSVKNPKQFEYIVQKYQQEFLKKVTYILKNKEEAEDIVQDAFVKMYLNASKFKEQQDASFKSWGYKILLNTCFSYLKKKKREKEFLDFADQEMIDLVSHSEKEYEKRLDLDQFMSVVSKIPVMLRKMLLLHVLEGKTYEDIAKMEGISMGTARMRLHRAKNEFKKIGL